MSQCEKGESFDRAALQGFYAKISTPEGVAIAEFMAELTGLFERRGSVAGLNDFRLSRGPWKKLANEVVPVTRFLKLRGIASGRIRFPLNSEPPDCYLWTSTPADAIGIEVTVALGTERYHLQEEMVRTGFGRGFLGVREGAPRGDFDSAVARRRIMYTAKHVLTNVSEAIRNRLSRKDDPKFASFILLIQAPLMLLPKERWAEIGRKLQEAAEPLPFAEVYVIGDADKRLGFQIK